jgi:hypothetical protein
MILFPVYTDTHNNYFVPLFCINWKEYYTHTTGRAIGKSYIMTACFTISYSIFRFFNHSPLIVTKHSIVTSVNWKGCRRQLSSSKTTNSHCLISVIPGQHALTCVGTMRNTHTEHYTENLKVLSTWQAWALMTKLH